MLTIFQSTQFIDLKYLLVTQEDLKTFNPVISIELSTEEFLIKNLLQKINYHYDFNETFYLGYSRRRYVYDVNYEVIELNPYTYLYKSGQRLPDVDTVIAYDSNSKILFVNKNYLYLYLRSVEHTDKFIESRRELIIFNLKIDLNIISTMVNYKLIILNESVIYNNLNLFDLFMQEGEDKFVSYIKDRQLKHSIILSNGNSTK